jgi:hypothetical protein
VANATPGVCVSVVGVLLVLHVALSAARLAGVFVAVMGAVLVVRGWRIAVLCEQRQVTVRGFLRTRTIARTAVIELTGFPALRWRSRGPLPGWTPIVAFMGSPGALAGIQQHNDEQLRTLERWLKHRR